MARQATRVEDVMLTDVITVAPGTPLEEFLEIAGREGISGAPVVDESGRSAGVVSLHDVVRELRSETARALSDTEAPPGGDPAAAGDGDAARRSVRERPGALSGGSGKPRTVGDVMTASVFSLRPETGVAEAARILADAEIHRAPVLRDGRVVGLVTTFHLLRALAD